MDLGNPIQYTSRDYDSIMNDIDSDAELHDKPNWWKRLWAGIGDVLSVWINSLANLLFLRTSFTRNSVADLLQLIDYTLTAHQTSSGYCLFYVDTSLGVAIFPFTVPAVDLRARSTGNLSVSSKIYESRTAVTFTLVSQTFTATPATDILTVATDVVYTGHRCRVSTTGTLPAPLAVNTDYYIIRVNATSIKLANSLAEAFAGVAIDITSAGTAVQTLVLYSKAVLMYQQETLTAPISLGVSDGLTKWQEFDIPNKFFLQGTESMTVNALAWTRVDTFVDSISTDRHYKIFPKANNMFAVRFGDGIYGAIPPAFDVMVTYSYGGGSSANVSVLNRIVNYAGSDANITGVSNPAVFTGGADEQSLPEAKQLGPLLLKSRGRFVETSDGEALVLAYGGIALTSVIKNFYGVLSCKVVGIANGGGNPSAALKTALQTYLIDRTILETVDVRVEDATITSVAVTAAAKMLPGYTYTAGVDKYFELAFLLFLSETGQEIKDEYEFNGIASAVTMINSVFTKTFTSTDYDQIQTMLDNLTPRDFGDVIQETDVTTFVQGSVAGIDYMTIAVFGGGFPMTLLSYEITHNGALTLTEIP